MRHFLSFFLALAFCSAPALAQQSDDDDLFQPQPQPRDQRETRQPRESKNRRQRDDDLVNPEDLTPNLSLPNNVWSETSPQIQICLGIGDVLFLGYSHQFEDPEFREAAQKFGAQDKKEKKVQRAYDALNSKKLGEQTELQNMQTRRDTLEKEIANQNEKIKRKEADLDKARRILTGNEKEVQLQRIKARLGELHQLALNQHQGFLHSNDDDYAFLSTREKTERENLRSEYNSLREMPNVNDEQKGVIIRDAEASLLTEQDARDKNITGMRQLGDEVVAQSHDIELLQGQLTEINGKLQLEQQTSSLLKKEMILAGRSKGIRRLGYKIVRIGGRFLFGIDLGSRVIYYYVVQEDPGWFPFKKLVERFVF